VVVAGATLATGLGSGDLPGLLWSLGALFCEVCFSLLAIPLLPKLGAVRVSAYSAALAVPLLVVIGLLTDGTAILRVPSLPEALSLGYQSVIVTTVAFFLWYNALPRLGPGTAGLFAGLIPIGAIATGVVLGLGVPTMPDLVGAALVIAGIVIGLSAAGSPAAATAPASVRNALRRP
jgi:drug/metabolite transporter (DMT)-like permease